MGLQMDHTGQIYKVLVIRVQCWKLGLVMNLIKEKENKLDGVMEKR
jgi:hypothetical protein